MVSLFRNVLFISGKWSVSGTHRMKLKHDSLRRVLDGVATARSKRALTQRYQFPPSHNRHVWQTPCWALRAASERDNDMCSKCAHSNNGSFAHAWRRKMDSHISVWMHHRATPWQANVDGIYIENVRVGAEIMKKFIENKLWKMRNHLKFNGLYCFCAYKNGKSHF